jgi:hypothetical protein
LLDPAPGKRSNKEGITPMQHLQARKVKGAVQRHLRSNGWPGIELTLADHTKEDQNPGNWSLTGPEGWGDWIDEVPSNLVPGAFIEPINCAILGVYDYE